MVSTYNQQNELPEAGSRGYDPARRRRSIRRGDRERGAWVYVTEAELRKTGAKLGPDVPPPDYRVWGGPRGGVVVSFYDHEPDG